MVNDIFSVRWMKVNGITYKTGYIVVLSVILTPLLGWIQNIIVYDINNYYFVCKLLDTVCFCKHFHSYEIRGISDIVIVKHEDLHYHM